MTFDTAQIRIRYAVPGDAEAITEIYNEAILTTTSTFDTEPQSVEERKSWLLSHGPTRPIFVAEYRREIVGWGSLSKWSERPAYSGTAETSFYVREEYRGRGIGRLLKQATIDEARKLGFHTLLARVAEGSEASLHLNESLGFTRVGTMKEVGHKFGRHLDVHLLQIMLD